LATRHAPAASGGWLGALWSGSSAANGTSATEINQSLGLGLFSMGRIYIRGEGQTMQVVRCVRGKQQCAGNTSTFRAQAPVGQLLKKLTHSHESHVAVVISSCSTAAWGPCSLPTWKRVSTVFMKFIGASHLFSFCEGFSLNCQYKQFIFSTNWLGTKHARLPKALQLRCKCIKR
jgi:hypothetical protein